MALSQYVGSNEKGEELMSELHLQYLNTIIKCVPAPEASNEKEENLEEIENCNETHCPEEVDQDTSDWFQWSANIYDNAQRVAVNCIEGTSINACYNPEFAAIIKTRLMPYVALWSAVMQPHFQLGGEIATSTSVEAEFAELKNRAFKGQLPMRADKFVHEHLDYIDGRIKLASCEKDILNTDCEQQTKLKHDYSSASSAEIQTDLLDNNSLNNSLTFDAINCDITKPTSTQAIKKDIAIDSSDIVDTKNQLLDCNVCETWRGLVRQSPEEQCCVKTRRKSSYLDKCPEWDYVKLARDHNIPLMRNGNVCKSITIDRKVITITQTCAFDAILHLIASGIASIKFYENKINSSNNRTITLAIVRSGILIAQYCVAEKLYQIIIRKEHKS